MVAFSYLYYGRSSFAVHLLLSDHRIEMTATKVLCFDIDHGFARQGRVGGLKC